MYKAWRETHRAATLHDAAHHAATHLTSGSGIQGPAVDVVDSLAMAL